MWNELFVIKSRNLELSIDEMLGSRITSLLWHGHEFVVQPRGSLMDWGWYAMVPWAGRIKNGLITDSSGITHTLPTNWEPPHAEHGFGFFSPWQKTSPTSTRFTMPYPYSPAFAEQEFEVSDNSLRWILKYTPISCQLPAWIGFHPWFPRNLEIGEEAILDFEAGRMLVRGDDLIPTGEFSNPHPPPWNDAFTDVDKLPSILWSGAAKVTISSSSPWWVIYSEDSKGICVEPQSAPPDAANLGISGAHQLEAVFTFSRQ